METLFCFICLVVFFCWLNYGFALAAPAVRQRGPMFGSSAVVGPAEDRNKVRTCKEPTWHQMLKTMDGVHLSRCRGSILSFPIPGELAPFLVPAHVTTNQHSRASASSCKTTWDLEDCMGTCLCSVSRRRLWAFFLLYFAVFTLWLFEWWVSFTALCLGPGSLWFPCQAHLYVLACSVIHV